MRRLILQRTRHIHPFNEAARELRVLNKPLWLWQHDLLAPYVAQEREYPSWEVAYQCEQGEEEETLVHGDNLFFNQALITAFIKRAREAGRPVRLAFSASDPAIAAYVVPLTRTLEREGALVLADLWYYPEGMVSELPYKLLLETQARERGYYHVPPYMADEAGDLVYQLPRMAFVHVESWVHLFIINILFGVFARGADVEDQIGENWRTKLRLLASGLMSQKRLLSAPALISIGRNVTIDPTAIVLGPTTIGDNVTIGAGAVIDNCIIGSNVNISQGCHLMLCVVSDGCFLPFRASLFMTTLMENSTAAQNACLQLSVIGRDSFVGAGTTLTDLNLLPAPLRASIGDELEPVALTVLGGCVGHHCRLSSGLVIQPARTIESDVVLLAKDGRQFIDRHISFEDSDHHAYQYKYDYPRLYPRAQEIREEVMWKG